MKAGRGISVRLQWTRVSSRSNTSEYSWVRRVLSGRRGRDSSTGNSRSKSGGKSRRNAKGSWPSCNALTRVDGVSGSEVAALSPDAVPVSYDWIGAENVGSTREGPVTSSLLLFSTPSESTTISGFEETKSELGFRFCSNSRYKITNGI